jgi:hypothetical protein
MDKKIMIGGGVAALALVVVFVVKGRSSAQAANDAEANAMPNTTPDTGYFSSMAPISGGNMSSDPGVGGIAMGGGGMVEDEGNSGSTESGGGFDFASVLRGMFSSQAEVNKMGVIQNGHNYDSAVLASFIGENSTASVTHTSTGTTISNNTNADSYTQIINDVYKSQLNRAPDAGGLAFWRNSLMNSNVSVSKMVADIQSQSEYASVKSAPSSETQVASVSKQAA